MLQRTMRNDWELFVFSVEIFWTEKFSNWNHKDLLDTFLYANMNFPFVEFLCCLSWMRNVADTYVMKVIKCEIAM